MNTHTRRVAGQRLPRLDGIGKVTGKHVYADVQSALAEIARVLTADGAFLLYDFSSGRSSVSDDNLERWFASFEQRFPWPGS